jgi:excisionase family DNA binding protein
MTSSSRQKPDRIWLDPKEAATYVGVSVKAIRNAYGRGELRHARLSQSRYAKIRIRLSWLDSWLERNAQGGER